jgi:hypothetical protein
MIILIVNDFKLIKDKIVSIMGKYNKKVVN